MRFNTLVASLIVSAFLLCCFVPAYSVSLRKGAQANSQSVTLTQDQYNALLAQYGSLLGNQNPANLQNQKLYKLPNGTIINQQQYDAMTAAQNAQSQQKLYKLPNGTIINQQQLDALNAQTGGQYVVNNGSSQNQTQASTPAASTPAASTPAAAQNQTLYKLPNGTIINQQQLDALNAQSGGQYVVNNGSSQNQTKASTPAASTPAASTPAASTPAASTPAASTPAASTPAATQNQTQYQLPDGTVLTQAQVDALKAQYAAQQAQNQTQAASSAAAATPAASTTNTAAAAATPAAATTTTAAATPAASTTTTNTAAATPAAASTASTANTASAANAANAGQAVYTLPNGTVLTQQQAQALLNDPNSGYSLAQ